MEVDIPAVQIPRTQELEKLEQLEPELVVGRYVEQIGGVSGTVRQSWRKNSLKA